MDTVNNIDTVNGMDNIDTIKELRVGCAIKIKGLLLGGQPEWVGREGIITQVDVLNQVVFVDIPKVTSNIILSFKDVEELPSGLIDNDGVSEELDNYVSTLTGRLGKLFTERDKRLKTVVADTYAEIADINKSLQKAYERLATVTRARKSRLAKAAHTRKEAYNLLVVLLRFYENIYIDVKGMELMAVTKNIRIPYKDTVVNLGQFRIKVSLEEIKVESLSGNGHPHISDKGHICWGDFGQRVQKSLTDEDWLTVLMLVADWVEVYNKDSCYTGIEKWLPDKDLRCKDCWELQEDCICMSCEHCGHRLENCNCDKCPSSGDIMPDGYDEFCRRKCEHWDKEDEVCLIEIHG